MALFLLFSHVLLQASGVKETVGRFYTCRRPAASSQAAEGSVRTMWRPRVWEMVVGVCQPVRHWSVVFTGRLHLGEGAARMSRRAGCSSGTRGAKYARNMFSTYPANRSLGVHDTHAVPLQLEIPSALGLGPPFLGGWVPQSLCF